jgi:hypothetical protein
MQLSHVRRRNQQEEAPIVSDELFDDEFAFHFVVAEATEFGAFEIVGAGSLGDEIEDLVDAF